MPRGQGVYNGGCRVSLSVSQAGKTLPTFVIADEIIRDSGMAADHNAFWVERLRYQWCRITAAIEKYLMPPVRVGRAGDL